MGSNGTGCDPNYKRLTLIEIENPPMRRSSDDGVMGRRATIGEQESGTNQADRRS
jgi:hypothetical protein